MATFEVYRTARTPKRCENYPSCERGIQPGERYLRASATPHDQEVNQGAHWWTINICCDHMRPERLGPECMSCHDGRGLARGWECSGCGRVGPVVKSPTTSPGLHACEGCGLELDGDDSRTRCEDCTPPGQTS